MFFQSNYSHLSALSPVRLESSTAVNSCHVFEMLKDGLVEVHDNSLHPTEDLISELAVDTIAGVFTSISFYSGEHACCGSSRQIVNRLRESDLVKFQLELGRGLAQWMVEQAQPLSIHGTQLLDPSFASVAPGYSIHCAKALPLHRDLAQFQSKDQIVLRPVTFSVIAWGGREGIVSKTSLIFAEAPLYSEAESGAEKRLLNSRPELSLLPEELNSATVKNAIKISLPDSCITIFNSSNRYHGASWDNFRQERLINKQIDAEVLAADRDVSFARPIHVVVL